MFITVKKKSDLQNGNNKYLSKVVVSGFRCQCQINIITVFILPPGGGSDGVAGIDVQICERTQSGDHLW